MKKKIDVLISFGFYGLGLLSFLLADIFVSENFSQENIAEWAFYKSTIIILGSIVLLGYDQVFVRDPSLVTRFLKRFVIQALVIATISVTLIAVFKGYTFQKGMYLFLGVLLFGFINYSSSSLRACFNLWKSQFSTNFWKVLLLGFLFFGAFEELSYYFLIPIALTLISAIIFGGYKTKEDRSLFENLSDADSRAIATTFLFTNLTLILAVYGEQFLINLSGDIKASAHLFKYFAVFTPIALSVNGFLGFYFGPKIRRQKKMSIDAFKKFSLKISVFAVLITLVSVMLGYVYMTYFSKIKVDTLDWMIITSLSVLCIIRGIYIATSVCLGIYSDKKRLKSVAILFWISAGLYIVGVFITLNITSGIQAAQIISILSVCNWLFRLIVSNIYTTKILKEIHVAS